MAWWSRATETSYKTLIDEGHDTPRERGGADPKTLDQELQTPKGSPTQNGLFLEAAREHHDAGRPAELVKV